MSAGMSLPALLLRVHVFNAGMCSTHTHTPPYPYPCVRVAVLGRCGYGLGSSYPWVTRDMHYTLFSLSELLPSSASASTSAALWLLWPLCTIYDTWALPSRVWQFPWPPDQLR